MRGEEARRQGAAFRGWLLEELRRRDWTAADLARVSGITPAAISKWMNLQRLPNYDTCQTLADTLGVSVDTARTKAGILEAASSLSPVQADIIAMVKLLPDDLLAVLRPQIRALLSVRVQDEIKEQIAVKD